MPCLTKTARRGMWLGTALFLVSCRMSGTDPRAGDNIDVPSERPGRNIAEAAEAEERREREADYSRPAADQGRGDHYEPAPYAGTSLPKPGTSNVTPDTEVTYGKHDEGKR